MSNGSYLFLVWLLPLCGAAFNLLVGRKMPRRVVYFVGCGAIFAAFVVAALHVAGPLWDQYKAFHEHGAQSPLITQTLYPWIDVGSLKINLAFRLDTLSAVMILVVSFVGFLIHVYSMGYMAHDERYASFFGYLNLFAGAMLILVLGDNLPVMFIGWEGVGLCSYLLIGFWYDRMYGKLERAYCGRKAFITNRIGDFAFLLGMFLLFWAVGSLNFSDFQTPEAQAAFQKSFLGGERLAAFAGVLLFIGATGKSAQIPLYVWLPDAMAGPTPVSALIHAATMVTAGVYMVARMSFLFVNSTTAMAIVAGIGALTALFAAIMALAQTELKRVLAYSTVSQLGFMFTAVGVGAYAAGIFHLTTHAFFKAGLFLAAGSIMHAMNDEEDAMKMGGLRKKMPLTHISFLVFCLAIAGIFPFSGFWSKDEIMAGAFSADAEGWASYYGELLWVILSIAAAGTAFYMFRLYWLTFGGKETRCDEETKKHIHESPPSMSYVLVTLAAFTCVIGFLGMPHFEFLGSAANWFGDWISPSVAPGMVHHSSEGTTAALMGIALVVGIIGIVIAWSLYKAGPSEKMERWTADGAGKKIHKVVFNKFYVDELYELIALRPFRWLARTLFTIIDRFVIDTVFVNGSALVVDVFGRVTRWFQNGQVQRYIAGVLVGGALLFAFTSRQTADFDFEPAPEVSPYAVKLIPDVGKGPSEKGSEVKWFIEGEEDKNLAPPYIKDFGAEGKYEVTLEVIPIHGFGVVKKVTKEIQVGGAKKSDAPGSAPAEKGGQP